MMGFCVEKFEFLQIKPNKKPNRDSTNTHDLRYQVPCMFSFKLQFRFLFLIHSLLFQVSTRIHNLKTEN